jgi:hAT family C-terminal dimerisation region
MQSGELKCRARSLLFVESSKRRTTVSKMTSSTPILCMGGHSVRHLYPAAKLELLYPVARAFLSVPATSAPAECVFSTAGFQVSKRRGSMNANRVRQLVRISRNVDLFPTTDDFVEAVAARVKEN